MVKRKGVALITILVVMVFVFILSGTILNVYLNSVNQNVDSINYDYLEYDALSGASIMSAYITEYNEEFENDFPTSTGYVVIEEGTNTARVYVQINNIDENTTEYDVKSVCDTDSQKVEVSVKILRTLNNKDEYNYEVGNYIYN